jgi:hypothetical protein
MQGESRLDGKVIPVRGWVRRSDRAKVRALRELALRYGGDPHLRGFVVNNVLRGSAEQRDYPKQAAAMLAWVQNNIYYTNEPDEQVQSPWRTIKVRTGDCDDSALSRASMAQSIRLPWKFVLAGKGRNGKLVRWVEGERPPWGVQFAHIYVQLGWPPFAPKQWASAEQTVRGAPLGYDVVSDGVRRWGEAAGSGLPELGDNSQSKAPRRRVHRAQQERRRMVAPGIHVGHTTREGFAGFGVTPVIADRWDDIVVGVITGVVGGVITAITINYILKQRGM